MEKTMEAIKKHIEENSLIKPNVWLDQENIIIEDLCLRNKEVSKVLA
jgi:hypothetical protein